MPEVDPAAEVFLRNLINACDIRFRRRCQVPANLGTEAEKLVTAVRIGRHVWTLADHEPNVNVVRVVRIWRYIQNFTIGRSSFLVVDVLICAYDFVQKSTVGLLIRGSCFEPWVNVETAVKPHRDLMELFEFSVFSTHEPRNGKRAKKGGATLCATVAVKWRITVSIGRHHQRGSFHQLFMPVESACPETSQLMRPSSIFFLCTTVQKLVASSMVPEYYHMSS
jgi:hypothetical protein